MTENFENSKNREISTPHDTSSGGKSAQISKSDELIKTEKTKERKEERIEIKQNTDDMLKAMNKKVYVKIPSKLPLKAELINEYLKLCEEKKVPPKYTKSQLSSKVVKTEIYELLMELKGGEGTKKEEGSSIMKSILPDIKVTKGVKDAATEFLFSMEHLAVGGLETYLNSRPNIGVDIDGLSYEMQVGKKEIKKDLRNIIEAYPVIAQWLNPILTHAVRMLNSGVRQHNHNRKNKPRHSKLLDTQNTQLKSGNSPQLKKPNRLANLRNKRKAAGDSMPLLLNVGGAIPK